MAPSRTIAEIKLSFIRDQIRTLSAALDPSPDWRDYGPQVEEDIEDKVVNDVLQKLNTILKQHSRAVFSTQAAHHVAQQIEQLYWNSINPELSGESAQQLVIDKGTDFTNSKDIARLPDEWLQDGVDEGDQSRYFELHQRLTKLDEERKKREVQLAQYKQLKALLEPFNEPLTNIQPNIVTKDGELGSELSRMRMLLARVASKVNQSGINSGSAEVEEAQSMDPGNKLSALLDMT